MANRYEYEMDDALGLGDGTLADIEVTYSVSGKYIPQTHWEPAEYPVLEFEGRKLLRVWDCEGNEVKVSCEDESGILQRFDELHERGLMDRLWDDFNERDER